MAKSKLQFKQTDVSRAVRGVVKAGVAVERVEIDRDTGNIAVIAKSPELSSPPVVLDENEWDGLFNGKSTAA